RSVLHASPESFCTARNQFRVGSSHLRKRWRGFALSESQPCWSGPGWLISIRPAGVASAAPDGGGGAAVQVVGIGLPSDTGPIVTGKSWDWEFMDWHCACGKRSVCQAKRCYAGGLPCQARLGRSGRTVKGPRGRRRDGGSLSAVAG